MYAIVIVGIVIGSLIVGVSFVENCEPLWKWIEKQTWWKEIV